MNDADNLRTGEGQDSYPLWSPDSTKMAYASSEEPPMAICIMNVDGSGRRLSTNLPAGAERADY